MYGFLLGREFKLCIAELLAVFHNSKIVFLDKNILILENITKENILEKANFLGGTIKIIEIEKISDLKEVEKKILNKSKEKDGKFKYGLSIYGGNINLKAVLNSTKKYLINNSISSRFINKDFKNLSSVQILGEKLISSGTDFSVFLSGENKFFGITIWIQDVESYSKRDYEKERDVQVGMLPPKLSQMMINIGRKNTIVSLSPQLSLTDWKIIYDPFCGLGTVLIEAVLMGYKNIYGSDLSDKMVESTEKNLKSLITNRSPLTPPYEGEEEGGEFNIFKLNAKFINEAEIFNKSKDFSIVTEGYLGEVMTKKNIDLERIKKQRESLSKLYEAFFSGLKNMEFTGNIVISFPFWEITGKYFYFDEIYNIIEKYCEVLELLPDELEIKSTKVGSLLYKRDKQLVGREIFKLKIKGV